MANPVVRFEALSQDADKLRSFYGELPADLPDTPIAVVTDPEGRAVGLSATPKD